VTTVAVIQPYFYPYAGYFRLFAAADAVVMFDCVQFPRRGWVHRNRFTNANGQPAWLTLPLVKADREVRIDQLRFPHDARERIASQLLRFPVLERAFRSKHPSIDCVLDVGDGDVAAYLCRSVASVARELGLGEPLLRSSTLAIDPALNGQDRVIAVVEAVGGKRYVNPSGGRALYDSAAFRSHGIALGFLTPYAASMDSVLSRMLLESHSSIAAEIRRENVVED
jgi:hypothetical protein